MFYAVIHVNARTTSCTQTTIYDPPTLTRHCLNNRFNLVRLRVHIWPMSVDVAPVHWTKSTNTVFMIIDQFEYADCCISKFYASSLFGNKHNTRGTCHASNCH